MITAIIPTSIEAKTFHQSNFHLSKEFLSSIQFLFKQRISFISPTSIKVENYFDQFNFRRKCSGGCLRPLGSIGSVMAGSGIAEVLKSAIVLTQLVTY